VNVIEGDPGAVPIISYTEQPLMNMRAFGGIGSFRKMIGFYDLVVGQLLWSTEAR